MKRARIIISGIMLPEFFKVRKVGELVECFEGLPEDAKFVKGGIYNNYENDSISLIFESEEFEDIKDGNDYPIITPKFRKMNVIDFPFLNEV